MPGARSAAGPADDAPPPDAPRDAPRPESGADTAPGPAAQVATLPDPAPAILEKPVRQPQPVATPETVEDSPPAPEPTPSPALAEPPAEAAAAVQTEPEAGSTVETSPVEVAAQPEAGPEVEAEAEPPAEPAAEPAAGQVAAEAEPEAEPAASQVDGEPDAQPEAEPAAGAPVQADAEPAAEPPALPGQREAPARLIPGPALLGVVVGLWAVAPNFTGPGLVLQDPSVEVIDHVFPGLVVVAVSILALVVAWTTARPGPRLFLSGAVVVTAGLWMVATHVPLLLQAVQGAAPWSAALYHLAPSVAALWLGVAWTARYWSDWLDPPD
ncbi:MAG: hypothetical protein QOD63_2815 [Actinomycetota bacterium]|jgi:hypothetical protein|nr:hypothetical protein [Actinomycetota bacterium]